MEIKNGKDKAGTATQFPYPIKLEYDEQAIILTPLWIPDKPQRGPVSADKKTLSELNAEGELQLCVEVTTSRRFHGQGKKNVKHGDKHPCRSGRFYVPLREKDYIPTQLVLGKPYVFPLFEYEDENKSVLVPVNLLCWFNNGERDSIYFNVRGTYRYKDSSVSTGVGPRTGIYSNEAKIVITK